MSDKNFQLGKRALAESGLGKNQDPSFRKKEKIIKNTAAHKKAGIDTKGKAILKPESCKMSLEEGEEKYS